MEILTEFVNKKPKWKNADEYVSDINEHFFDSANYNSYVKNYFAVSTVCDLRTELRSCFS